MSNATPADSRTRWIFTLIAVFVLTSAARDVFIAGLLGKSLFVSEVMFLSFVPVCLATNLIVALGGDVRSTFSAYTSNFARPLFRLNVWTAMLYITIYLSLALVAPATTATIGVGLIPLFLAARTHQLRSQRLPCLTVLVGVLLSSVDALRDPIRNKPTDVAIGIALAIAAAYAASSCIIYSGILNRSGLTAHRVFAARFWFLLLASLIWSIVERSLREKWGELEQVAPETIGMVLVVGIVGISLPLYVMQYLIAYDQERRYVGFAVPLIPVAVFFLQLLIPQVSAFVRQQIPPDMKFSWLTLIGAVIVAVGCYFGMRPPRPAR